MTSTKTTLCYPLCLYYYCIKRPCDYTARCRLGCMISSQFVVINQLAWIIRMPEQNLAIIHTADLLSIYRFYFRKVFSNI